MLSLTVVKKLQIDKIVPWIGIVVGIIICSMYLLSSTIYLLAVGIPTLAASILYILTSISKQYTVKYEKSRAIKILYDILFFIFLSIGIYSLHVSEVRSIFYFLLMSLCAAMISLSIFEINSKKDITFCIMKVFILAFTLVYSIYYSYSHFALSDSTSHAVMNSQLAISGDISSLWAKEMYFPLMHINVAITKILLDLNIANASNIAVIIPVVIASICVYLVTRTIFNEKVGLFALLILNITDFGIYWASLPQTTTYGIAIYFFIIFIFFKTFLKDDYLQEYNKGQKWKLLGLLLIFSMILTHAVSSFILLVTFFGFFLGTSLYRYIYDKNNSVYFFTLNLITTIGILQYWMIALYKKGGNSFFYQIASFLITSFSAYMGFLNRPESVAEFVVTLPPFVERFVNIAGLSILLLFAIIGSYFWLSKKYLNVHTYSILTCIILLLGLTFGFPFLGIRNIIPDRWFIFEYFFLSIMASFGLSELFKYIRNADVHKIIAAMFFFLLCFLMISNTIPNTDNPLWLEDSTPSLHFTTAEVRGYTTLSKFSSFLISDYQFGRTFLEIKEQKERYSRVIYSTDEIYNKNNSIFLWRKHTVSSPVRSISNLNNTDSINYNKMKYTSSIFGQSFTQQLDKYNKVYTNNEIAGYLLIN